VTDYVIYGFNLAQQTRNMSYSFVMLLFQRMISSSTQAILDSMEKRAELVPCHEANDTGILPMNRF